MRMPKTKFNKLVLMGVLAIAALAGARLMSAQPLPRRATKFVQYLEASRGARDTQGKLTLWERVVYSYILAAS